MPDASAKPLNVLMVRGAIESGTDLATWLGQRGRVEFVDSLAEAVDVLATDSYDVVLASAAELSQPAETQIAQQAATILEHVAQGVCIVGPDGQMVWANPKLLSFSESVREKVSQFCLDTFSWATSEPARRPSHLRGRRFTITTDDNEFFEVTATPVIDLDHRITQVAAVVWEATKLKHLQEKLDAIDHAGRELVGLDTEQFSRLDTQERLALLEQKIIRYTRDLMRFHNFAVRLLDKNTNKLEVVISSGMPTEAQDLDLYASSDGNGISGYVAHTGRSYICPDVTKDSRYLTGLADARSSLTVPLRLNDTVIGVLNVESDEPAAFTEDHRQFAEIFARHVALALHILDLLVSERYTATGKLGSDVMAEIRGPVSDILNDVASLKEDYIGQDDLRHRLDKISDYAVAIRESMKQVTNPGRGLITRRTTNKARRDPILGGKRVLIADDEEVIRETVCDVLTSYGCEVCGVPNGQEAIDAIGRTSFDLVLSDIRMPLKSGYDVFAAAKEANSSTPVILMTGFGYDPNHSIVRARRDGLAAVLFKPFKVEQLLGELRTAIRNADTKA